MTKQEEIREGLLRIVKDDLNQTYEEIVEYQLRFLHSKGVVIVARDEETGLSWPEPLIGDE